jgi:hypothetical protein
MFFFWIYCDISTIYWEKMENINWVEIFYFFGFFTSLSRGKVRDWEQRSYSLLHFPIKGLEWGGCFRCLKNWEKLNIFGIFLKLLIFFDIFPDVSNKFLFGPSVIHRHGNCNIDLNSPLSTHCIWWCSHGWRSGIESSKMNHIASIITFVACTQ